LKPHIDLLKGDISRQSGLYSLDEVNGMVRPAHRC
jgi:hypothetical protein